MLNLAGFCAAMSPLTFGGQVECNLAYGDKRPNCLEVKMDRKNATFKFVGYLKYTCVSNSLSEQGGNERKRANWKQIMAKKSI